MYFSLKNWYSLSLSLSLSLQKIVFQLHHSIFLNKKKKKELHLSKSNLYLRLFLECFLKIAAKKIQFLFLASLRHNMSCVKD